MQSTSATERTPLAPGGGIDPNHPQYVFTGGPRRRQKIRQFQCCVCATVLAVFVLALVITISFDLNHQSDDTPTNSTTAPPTNPTTILAPTTTSTSPTVAPPSVIPPVIPPSSDNAPISNLTTASLMVLLGLPYPLPFTGATNWTYPEPSKAEMGLATKAGQVALEAKDTFEATSPSLASTTPSFRSQQAMSTSPAARRAARQGYVEDYATMEIIKINPRITPGMPWSIGHGPSLEDTMAVCAVVNRTAPCKNEKFRSADGTCNNLLRPDTWGVAMRPFRRALPPDYADGVSAPRASNSPNGSLPSARDVSTGVHRPMYRSDPNFSAMLAVWGQFLDHDITATALSKGTGGVAIQCCNATTLHPECFPVMLSRHDQYYQKYGVTCMEFVRSAPAPKCRLGPREQLNQMTSYIDGSMVYGSDEKLTSHLRAGWGGRLRMLETNDSRTLLPQSRDPNDGCNEEEQNKLGRYCFESGDARANENLHLTTMHLLWARQHNRLADNLQELNPRWDDDRVFQEARRIVGAQLQHITYNEFLPIIVGSRLTSELQLNPSDDRFTGYDPEVDASVANQFASCVFRFGHTLLPGLMRLTSNNSSPDVVELHHMLFNPYSLYNRGGPDRALQRALDTNIAAMDPHVTNELTGKLFQDDLSKPDPQCGLDLVSLNIQRGRDHGLPSYPAWRRLCGLSTVESWNDLQEVVDKDSLQRMRDIYSSVDDIDLYTGALSEIPLGDGIGLLGPVLTCLITDQFVRLKRGDRFWYETAEAPQAFTSEQLKQIRSTTLAGIICANADAVEHAQQYVMRSVSAQNPQMTCAELDTMDFKYWDENPDKLNSTSTNTMEDDNSSTVNSDQIVNGHVKLRSQLTKVLVVTPNNVTAVGND